MGTVADRARLIARIEVEARAFANADSMIRNLRYGRVLGLLEAGVVLDYWSRRTASGVANGLYHGASVRRVVRRLDSTRRNR